MADFFGFNPSTDFEHELHDDPGDGLDEDADDYDALNDETFGADSMGGDWEQDHEELAQITELSRPHRDSCGSPPPPAPAGDKPAGRRSPLRDDEGDLGLDNLGLEASLAQLVDDGDEQHDEEKSVGTRANQQRTALTHQRVMEPGYSCSPPSEFNVWAVNRVDQARQLADVARQQQAQMLPLPLAAPKMPKVHTLEELERDLRAHPTSVFPAPRPAVPPAPVAVPIPVAVAPLRLEDLERDLTAPAKQLAAAKLPPPGFQTPPPQQHRAHFQHSQEVGGHPNGMPPPPHGYPPHAGGGGRGSAFLPPPHMLDYRQQHRHMGPNMLRFMPPHPMMGNQQYQQHRPHMGGFRHPYQIPPPGMDPRHYPPHLRPPYPRLRHPPPPPGHRPANGYHNAGDYHHNAGDRHHHGGGNAEYHHCNVDEYDGLMNEREVRWLLNIQMLQLNTSQPYRDDFYYTVYQSRQPKNRPDNRNGRERRDSNRDNWPDSQQSPRVYTPLQFENSLGKLQCGSVTTPRKIIDMDVVSEPADSAQAQQKDSRRAKQLLLCLEQMYLLLMQVEDADNPLAEPAEVDTAALVAKIVTTLLTAEDRLQAALCVGKGKNLLLRLLPYLTPLSPHSAALSTLWCCLLKNLIPVGRRDAEADALSRFYPHFARWAGGLDEEGLGAAVRALRVAAPYPPSRNLLVYALTHKFGVSALTALLTRAAQLCPDLATPTPPDLSALASDLLEASGLVDPPQPPRPVASLRPDAGVAAATVAAATVASLLPGAAPDRLAVLVALLTGGGDGREAD